MYTQSYLAHHGIKGQKWGVKNGPPYPLDESQQSPSEQKKGLTDKQKKVMATGVIATTAILATVGTVYYIKKSDVVNPLAYANMTTAAIDLTKVSNAETVLSKDTKLQRISSKSVEEYEKDGKSIYAAYLHRDKAIYKEQIPRYIKQWKREGIVGEKTAYVHKMKLKRDIRIASEKAVMEAYMKVNDVNEVKQAYFINAMTGLVDRNNEMSKKLIAELKSKGYDGLIDYNDAGVGTSKGLTKAPLFIFNPGEVIESSKSHKLGAVEKFINVLTA